MNEAQDPKPAGKPIVNKTDASGAVLCPACNRGTVWDGDDGKRYTSPMQKLFIPGKVNALFHKCCIAQLMRRAAADIKANQTEKAKP